MHPLRKATRQSEEYVSRVDYDNLLHERDELVIDKIDLENQIHDMQKRTNEKHFEIEILNAENDVNKEHIAKLEKVVTGFETLRIQHDEILQDMKSIEKKYTVQIRRLEKKLESVVEDIRKTKFLCPGCKQGINLYICKSCSRGMCRTCYFTNDFCVLCNGVC
jgi:predicted nuclease with TOPRIM domain